jgi:RNA polymerase sigma factor (sigma-70 family)
MAELTRELRRLLTPNHAAADADLLGQFVADRDGLAFAALVARHGPMVLAVCRRVLRHRQDAEDAFQATFLVLARRAAAVKPRALLGNWLYGVAYRTALAARRVARARRAREAKAAAQRGEEAAPEITLAPDLRAALDRELAALPDIYRAAVVACDLEGLSRREALARLGWTEGTLASRLARARALLARRLARYGLAVPAMGLAAAAGPAVVASGLAEPTVRLGTLVAAGEAAVAAPVAALMEGAMRTFVLTKIKGLTAAAVLGCAVAMTTVAGWRADAAGTASPQKPADAPQKVAPSSDKDRIAELEREREMLLKKLAALEARLTQLENEKAAERDLRHALEVLKAAEEQRAREIADHLAKERAWQELNRLTDHSAKAPKDVAPGKPAEKGAAPKAPDEKGADPSMKPAEKGTAPKFDSKSPDTPNKPVEKGTAPKFDSKSPDTTDVPPQSKGSWPGPGSTDKSGSWSPAPDKYRSAPQPETAIETVVRLYPVGDLAGDEKDGEALAKVVRATVAPKSWGVDAGVEYLPARKVLVVRQSVHAHKEVAELIQLLQKQSVPSTPATPK